MHVLLIEDDAVLGDLIRLGLEGAGYTVARAADGLEGERMAREGHHDILVVDWMLPGRSGPDLLGRLRSDGIRTPALLLTSRAELKDRVTGLDAGADDYLVKPFAFEELYARLRALARRTGGELELHVGPLTIDRRARRAAIGGTTIPLRAKEFAVLERLAEEPGRAVAREDLAEHGWGEDFTGDDVLNVTGTREEVRLSTTRVIDCSSVSSSLPLPIGRE